MTAKQMLKYLQDAKWIIKEDLDKEIKIGMGYEEFLHRHNLVSQPRCCEHCRFGVLEWDGDCSCVHPDRLGVGDNNDVRYNTCASDVCDAWEERTPENENIPEYDDLIVNRE